MVLKYYFLHARYLLKLEKGDFKNWETRTILISFYPSCRSSPAGYNSDYWNTRRPKRANWIIRWWMEDERRGWSETSARIGTVGRQLAAVATENPRRHNKCAELRPVKRGRWGEALVGGGPGGGIRPLLMQIWCWPIGTRVPLLDRCEESAAPAPCAGTRCSMARETRTKSRRRVHVQLASELLVKNPAILRKTRMQVGVPIKIEFSQHRHRAGQFQSTTRASQQHQKRI